MFDCFTTRLSTIKVLPLLPKVLELHRACSAVGLGEQPRLLLFYLLVVLCFEDSVVLLGVLEGVADEFHPQSLQLDLLHGLLLQGEVSDGQHSLREVLDSTVHLLHAVAHALLLLEGLVELQHVEVGHQEEVVHGGLFQGLHDEVVHVGEVVEEEGRRLIEEDECGVELMQPHQGLQDGQEQLDDVVELEDPDESDLGAPPEDVVVGYLALPAGVVELLVGRQLHQVVVEGDEQFLADEGLHVLWLGLDLVVLVLAGLGEDLDLLAEDDVADVVLADLADLDEHHHHLQLAAARPLLLQLLDQRLQQRLLPPILAALLEEAHSLRNHLNGEAISADAQPLQLLRDGVLFEKSINQLHYQFLLFILKQWATASPTRLANIIRSSQGAASRDAGHIQALFY